MQLYGIHVGLKGVTISELSALLYSPESYWNLKVGCRMVLDLGSKYPNTRYLPNASITIRSVETRGFVLWALFQAMGLANHPKNRTRKYDCFHNLGVLVGGILVTRALPFGVYIRAPSCWELPYCLA